MASELEFTLADAPKGGGDVPLDGLTVPVCLNRMFRDSEGYLSASVTLKQHAASAEYNGHDCNISYSCGQPAIEVDYRGETARIVLTNELLFAIADKLGAIADAGGERGLSERASA